MWVIFSRGPFLNWNKYFLYRAKKYLDIYVKKQE
jgi:hypothetical protein